jgi:hypothetical protein
VKIEDVAMIIATPVEEWAFQCHAISLAIVKSGLLPSGSRVARGACHGVPGQHSWIVVGDGDGLADAYADDARIMDATLWSYTKEEPYIWEGSALEGRHKPHGKYGHIMQFGRPPKPVEEPVPLAPAQMEKLSSDAKAWVNSMFGPLDRRGWMALGDHTMEGWPAGEIIKAAALTPYW